MLHLKSLLFVALISLGFSIDLAHAEDSKTEVESLLKRNKNILKKCAIDVKDGGKVVKFFEGLKYSVEEPACSTSGTKGETKLICSPNAAKDREVSFRNAMLIIEFDSDGDFKEAMLRRYIDGGFAGSYGSNPFITVTCDDSCKCDEKSPMKKEPTPESKSENDSNDED